MVLNVKNSLFYKEALTNLTLYNSQLSRDRSSRLPYFDGQTGVVQKGKTETTNGLELCRKLTLKWAWPS